MTTPAPTQRDYSLIGRDTQARDRERARRRRMVQDRHPAQADEGADEAHGRAGHPRHDHLARRLRRPSDARRLLPGARGGPCRSSSATACSTARDGFALARMRPRHGIQDALDERRRLSARLLHGHARADDLALEPYPPPHRHDHRRPRPGDRGACARRDLLAILPNYLRAESSVAHGRSSSCMPPGGWTPRRATFIPEMERWKVYRVARIWLAISSPP